jgi:hypothetical protein
MNRENVLSIGPPKSCRQITFGLPDQFRNICSNKYAKKRANLPLVPV